PSSRPFGARAPADGRRGARPGLALRARALPGADQPQPRGGEGLRPAPLPPRFGRGGGPQGAAVRPRAARPVARRPRPFAPRAPCLRYAGRAPFDHARDPRRPLRRADRPALYDPGAGPGQPDGAPPEPRAAPPHRLPQRGPARLFLRALAV